jgi:hypothetical protein
MWQYVENVVATKHNNQVVNNVKRQQARAFSILKLSLQKC